MPPISGNSDEQNVQGAKGNDVKLQLHLLRAAEDRRPMVSSKSGIGERRDREQTPLFHAGSVRAICSLRSGANKREQTDYPG